MTLIGLKEMADRAEVGGSLDELLEIQARLLGRLLEGEIGEYPVFLTR